MYKKYVPNIVLGVRTSEIIIVELNVDNSPLCKQHVMASMFSILGWSQKLGLLFHLWVSKVLPVYKHLYSAWDDGLLSSQFTLIGLGLPQGSLQSFYTFYETCQVLARCDEKVRITAGSQLNHLVVSANWPLEPYLQMSPNKQKYFTCLHHPHRNGIL